MEFTIKDNCLFIDDATLPIGGFQMKWNTLIPIKVNIFCWRVFLNRLPTKDNLILRDNDMPIVLCPIFGVHAEDVNHVFLSCYVANKVMNKVGQCCDLVFFLLYCWLVMLGVLESASLSRARKDVLDAIISTTW